MRNGLAGISISDATGDDLGRSQRHRHRLCVRSVVSLDLDRLERESWIDDAQVSLEAAAHAMNREPSVGIGGRRLGPGRPVVHASPPVERTFEANALRIRGLRTPNEDTYGPGDRHRDALSGPALQIEEASLDHLLRVEPDIGDGLIGVGIELGPADTVARRQSHGHELVVPRRRSAGRIEAELTRSVGFRIADHGRIQSFGTDSIPELLDPRVNHHLGVWALACLAGRARDRRRTSGPGQRPSPKSSRLGLQGRL